MDPLFVADSFGKTFGKTEVLKAATAWATPGRVTVLFGRNGSGKTTLIRGAMGLQWSDFGMVRYDGVSFLKPRLHILARQGLMYLPDRNFLSRRRTVGWHHEMLAIQSGRAVDRAAIEAMGVGDLLEQVEGRLSGGERRRAELSLVLARRPRCLIADEPLAGIAPADKEEVSAALRSLAHEGCAILVTGHDVNALMDLSDDVIWMVAGTTHWMGSPEAACAHDQFRREYLGPRGYSR